MEMEGNEEDLDDDVDNDDEDDDTDMGEPINTEDEDQLLLTDEDIEEEAISHNVDQLLLPGDNGELESCPTNENCEQLPLDDIDDIEADFREFIHKKLQVEMRNKNDFIQHEGGVVCEMLDRSRLVKTKKQRFELCHTNSWVTAEDLYYKLGFCVEVTRVRKKPKRKPLQCLNYQSAGGEDKKDWALQKSIELYWQKYYAETFCNLVNNIFYGNDSKKLTTEDDEIDLIFAPRGKKKQLDVGKKGKLSVKNKKLHRSRLKSVKLENKPVSLDLTEGDDDDNDKVSQDLESKRPVVDDVTNINLIRDPHTSVEVSGCHTVVPFHVADKSNVPEAEQAPDTGINSIDSEPLFLVNYADTVVGESQHSPITENRIDANLDVTPTCGTDIVTVETQQVVIETDTISAGSKKLLDDVVAELEKSPLADSNITADSEISPVVGSDTLTGESELSYQVLTVDGTGTDVQESEQCIASVINSIDTGLEIIPPTGADTIVTCSDQSSIKDSSATPTDLESFSAVGPVAVAGKTEQVHHVDSDDISPDAVPVVDSVTVAESGVYSVIDNDPDRADSELLPCVDMETVCAVSQQSSAVDYNSITDGSEINPVVEDSNTMGAVSKLLPSCNETIVNVELLPAVEEAVVAKLEQNPIGDISIFTDSEVLPVVGTDPLITESELFPVDRGIVTDALSAVEKETINAESGESLVGENSTMGTVVDKDSVVTVAEQSRVVNSNTIYVDSELSFVAHQGLSSIEPHSVVATCTESNSSPGKTDTDRSFPCSTCGKAFALRFALNKHKAVHDNVNVENEMEKVCQETGLEPGDEMVPDSEGEDFQEEEEDEEEAGESGENVEEGCEDEDDFTDDEDFDEDDAMDSDYVAETDEDGSDAEMDEMDAESDGMKEADEGGETTAGAASETASLQGADNADPGVMDDEAFLCSVHDKRPQSVGKKLVDTTGKGCFLCNIFNRAKGGVKKTYSCSLCYKNFPTIKTLRTHQNSHFRQKRFKCRTCEERFRDKEKLKEHETVHKKEKTLLMCKVCGDGFRMTSSFRTHLVSHTVEKPFMCTLCDGRFKFLPQLKVHHLTHVNDTPFGCKKCNKTYRHKATWRKHRLKHRLISLSRGDGKEADLVTLNDEDLSDDDFDDGITGITTSASLTSSTTTTISTATTTTLISTSPTSKTAPVLEEFLTSTTHVHVTLATTSSNEAATIPTIVTANNGLEPSPTVTKLITDIESLFSQSLSTPQPTTMGERSPSPSARILATTKTDIHPPSSSALAPPPTNSIPLPSSTEQLTRKTTDTSPPPSPPIAKRSRVELMDKGLVLSLTPISSMSSITGDTVTTTAITPVTTTNFSQQNGIPAMPNEINTCDLTISDDEDTNVPKKVTSFICETCGRSFSSRIKLKKHEAIHSKRTKKISCKFCDQKFYSKVVLRNHEKTHEEKSLSENADADGGPIVEDGNEMANQSHLNNNKELHCNGSLKNGEPEVLDLCMDESDEEVERHPCPICGKSFKSIANLRKHEEKKHILNRGKLFPCEVCELTFSTKILLIKHAKIHRIRERTLTPKINVEAQYESIDLSDD